jgi:hypothetical protein
MLLFVRIRKKGSIWIFTYEAKSLYPLTVLISLCPYILFSILKIIYSDQQLVGRDILITMVYMLCPMLTFFTLVCYFFIVIRFLKSLTATMAPEIGNKVARRFNLLTTLIFCIPPLAIITCGMPVMGIPFPRYRNIFAKFSLIGNGMDILYMHVYDMYMYGTYICMYEYTYESTYIYIYICVYA